MVYVILLILKYLKRQRRLLSLKLLSKEKVFERGPTMLADGESCSYKQHARLVSTVFTLNLAVAAEKSPKTTILGKTGR